MTTIDRALVGRLVLGLAILAALAVLLHAAVTSAKPQRVAPGGQLTAFASDADLRAFLKRIQQRQRRESASDSSDIVVTSMAVSAPPPAMEAAAPAPGITNTQSAGVDEGGIVKQRGDMLVILRRGRLFTVATADRAMRPIDSIDAFPPGVSARGDWYDEMLIAGNRVIVIGYSYSRGGTEINRFRLGADGRLSFDDAYHLRSNDYYSSRNYASRQIGNRLVMYAPLYLGAGRDPLDALPGLRRWNKDDADGKFRRIATARQVFIPPVLRNARDAQITALHSVTSCDLTAPVMDCQASGVLGAESRNFYVSSDAVYLWISDAWSHEARRGRAQGFVYRLPLDRAAPQALAVRGAPVDQFSFREDKARRTLDVLVRDAGGSDAMFGPEVSGGGFALAAIPLDAFGDGGRALAASRYRRLPALEGNPWSVQNRFAGRYILYGAGGMNEREASGGTLVAAGIDGGTMTKLSLPHSVDRIDLLGRDAVVIGAGTRGLGFTAIDLSGTPRATDRYLLPDAEEGETRSHAFFFRADPATPDGASGLLGLPVARAGAPDGAPFFGRSAAMLFLARGDRRFSPAGELAARPADRGNDGCQASCVDWYGNARPIFMGNRILALMGYELVEGQRGANGAIREIDRVDFTPGWRERERRSGG